MDLEKILKNSLISLLFLGLTSCSNPYKKFISRLQNGEVEIKYEQLTNAIYVTRKHIIESGIEKHDSRTENQLKAIAMIFSGQSVPYADYELREDVKGYWVLDKDNKFVLRGSIGDNEIISPKLNPKNNIPEGFIVPTKENDKIIFYAFIDKDFMKKKPYIEPFYSQKEKNMPKFRSAGNGIYVSKFPLNKESGWPFISAKNTELLIEMSGEDLGFHWVKK